MQVAQRGTSTASITTGGYYTADRWYTLFSALGTWTQTVENDAPTGSGLSKSLKMLCTTAKASPAAGDLFVMQQLLEGQDLQRIAKGTASAQQLTLSFWVKSNVTGTFIAALYDSGNTRTVSATYSISASATWEKKTITFPADTTGTLANTNAAALNVNFWLAAGSNFTSGTLNTTWATYANANAYVGGTNLAAATNNYWQVTGVQLEVGPVASAFEFKSYGQELRECQRYYYLHAEGNGDFVGVGWMYDGGNLGCAVHFPTTMRTAPSLTVATGTNFYGIDRNSGTDNFNSFFITRAQENCTNIANNSEISGTAGNAGQVFTNNASASIAFSAEL